jgi:mono/diheme cytochrome c family protein
MTQARHVILIPALLATLGSPLGCTKGQTNAATLPAQPAALSGPESYQLNCVGCHGAKGEGVKDLGPELKRLGIRIPHDDQLRHIIRNGRGKMPPYRSMSDTELEAVIAYIKKF